MSAAVAQVWIWLRADDPEAVSALSVARRSLEAGRGLVSLRRFRLYEVNGALPERAEIEDLLHRSTQFYNPQKERCAVRLDAGEPAPVEPSERLVVVFDRGGERRDAAERWWLHVTGSRIEVREGVVWALGFAPGTDGAAATADLALLRDARHGLFCNPHAQECVLADRAAPFPWLVATAGRSA